MASEWVVLLAGVLGAAAGWAGQLFAARLARTQRREDRLTAVIRGDLYDFIVACTALHDHWQAFHRARAAGERTTYIEELSRIAEHKYRQLSDKLVALELQLPSPMIVAAWNALATVDSDDEAGDDTEHYMVQRTALVRLANAQVTGDTPPGWLRRQYERWKLHLYLVWAGRRERKQGTQG